jgi:hypothetical protein
MTDSAAKTKPQNTEAAASADTTGALEARPAHSSSYPVSRLAPAFHAPDLSDQIGRVEAMLSARTSAKLGLIADQIRHLQDSARAILKDAEQEQTLHQAECAFERKPGHAYHLYRKDNGQTFWSMLSPRDWRGQPPHHFTGSYRLEADYSWTQLHNAPEE